MTKDSTPCTPRQAASAAREARRDDVAFFLAPGAPTTRVREVAEHEMCDAFEGCVEGKLPDGYLMLIEASRLPSADDPNGTTIVLAKRQAFQ